MAEADPRRSDPSAEPPGSSPHSAEPPSPHSAEPAGPRVDDGELPPPADPWGDETVIGGTEPITGPPVGPTGTGILPPVSAEDRARWSARAAVPPAAPDPVYPEEWGAPEEPEPRSPLYALTIALVVLVLLAIIGFGLWLALRDHGSGTAPTPVPNTTTSTAARTTRATTPPATTSAATGSAPAGVVSVPVLSGQSYAGASAQLAALNLGASRVNEPSSTVPAGQVIRSEPGVGVQVVPGTVIRLVVSSGAPPTTPAPTTSAAATGVPSPS